MNKEFIEIMTEAFTDAEVISKAFLKQAIDRSKDLGVNPVLTLTMVRALCDLGIEEHKEKFVNGHPLGKSMVSGEFDVFEELENLVTSTIKDAYNERKAQRSRG